jgi:uncharacterized membrane protein YeaQ/YmgE (transglycosylase-associated protein family)
MDYVWMALIGLIAGSLGGHFITGKGQTVVGDIVTGIMGAMIGGVLFKLAGLFPATGLTGGVMAAITGAIVLLYGSRVVRKS